MQRRLIQNKILLRSVFCAFLVFVSFLTVVVARASSVDGLRLEIEAKSKEIRKLEEEARVYKENIAAKEKEVQTLKGQISKIDLMIRKLNSDIRLTNARISKARLEVQQLGEEISSKEIAIQKARRGLRGLLAAISQNDAEGALTILAKYESFTRFFDALYYISGVGKSIQGELSDLRSLKQELEEAKRKTEAKRIELAALLSQLSDQKEIQDGQRNERSSILAETRNQEKKFQQLLEVTEAQQEIIQKEIEGLEEKLREAVDPSSLPPKRQGALAWPTAGILSQGYGRTAFAKRSDFYSFHNGIDIKASIGTSIVAAEDGVIIATGDTDRYCRRGAYGKYVVMRHNNNLTTLYAHLSLIRVSSGDTVKRGELIGYMGSSGLSTGPHLHFTVYDSRTVEIKQSRVCGLIPYGGSVNPLGYL